MSRNDERESAWDAEDRQTDAELTNTAQSEINTPPPPEPSPAHEPVCDHTEGEGIAPADPENTPEEDASEEEEEEILAEQRPQEMERHFTYLEELLDTRHYADFRHELEELNPVDSSTNTMRSMG